ncbi:hypothetical protein CcarbDRAFT_0801 [Clostridium carboxidivorans P7]|uniref:Beta-lactamase domain protein n=1 Tax=Clostridium carboxidivorans P7 TaxID=536227 RepID=C6PPT4_9CLOT|nr:hypothetical protein [Clostridium carboxidivorans]EET88814.1 hypothetical protein CcarbDRAFT_0801 [Clostridium carboxidivorans P7]
MGEVIDKVYKPHVGEIHNQDLDYIYEKDNYEKDTSDTNAASISFLFTYNDKCIAFLGDAHAEDIIDDDNEILTKAHIDFVKLPHHGSPYNVSEELIKFLGCSKFIISTKQTVEKKTIARIVHAVDKCTIYCNYAWFSRNSYFTNNDKEKYIKTGKLIMKELIRDEFWKIGDEND